MKNFIYLFCSICLFACKDKSATVSITGKVDSCNGTKVIIVNPDDHNLLDSTIVENGQFKLKSSVEKEGFYQIWFRSPVVEKKSWSHPCLIYLEDKGSYTFLAGGPNDVLYNRYTIKTTSKDQRKINELRNLENKLSIDFKHKKKEIGKLMDHYLVTGETQLHSKYQDSLYKLDSLGVAENRKLRLRFIAQNTGTHYTPYLINQATDRFENYSLYSTILDHLDARVKDAEIAEEASERLDAVTKLYKGADVPPIKGRDIEDNKISVDYSRTKYTLINFWASYCVPCRRETPELRKLYTTYKNGKLNIISISIDENRDYWLTASKQDSIPWPNIAELTLRRKSLNIKNFILKVIPANYLVNQQGKIIARDIAISELEKLLSK